jgi:hypothetical protein
MYDVEEGNILSRLDRLRLGIAQARVPPEYIPNSAVKSEHQLSDRAGSEQIARPQLREDFYSRRPNLHRMHIQDGKFRRLPLGPAIRMSR